ncbi:unnamed protein product [Adineta ricciae]|uniref:Cysteine-rich transmembrane CYSTM domain-containing protein n=1 Tax=Adineta ricciae TaxID=249248 RepID=A0A815HMA2_ADIRI|nr:unnamed protein product [Adineta ricciae]
MTSVVHKQPSTLDAFNMDQNVIEKTVKKTDDTTTQESALSKDNFPKGLRGGGACFDCLACLCICCALEEIACLECCRDC